MKKTHETRSGPSFVAPAALRRADLPSGTVALARYLIGCCLVHELPEGRVSGRIVETEAYPPGDSTNHAFRGRRADNGSMYLAPGHAYVKLTYGTCWVLNVSSEPAGEGAAVLLRALEPLEGVDFMTARRPGARPLDLTRGPGRLAQAMGIDGASDGADLCTGKGLWLAGPAAGAPVDPSGIGVTTRIGLSRETHRLLRFYVRGSRLVSGPRGLLSPE